MAQLEGFAEARRINVNEMKNVVRSLLTVLRGALRKNLLPKAIVDDLGLLGSSFARACCACVWVGAHARMLTAIVSVAQKIARPVRGQGGADRDGVVEQPRGHVARRAWPDAGREQARGLGLAVWRYA